MNIPLIFGIRYAKYWPLNFTIGFLVQVNSQGPWVGTGTKAANIFFVQFFFSLNN